MTWPRSPKKFVAELGLEPRPSALTWSLRTSGGEAWTLGQGLHGEAVLCTSKGCHSPPDTASLPEGLKRNYTAWVGLLGLFLNIPWGLPRAGAPCSPQSTSCACTQ